MSSRCVPVVCRWQTDSATFDLAANAPHEIRTLHQELRACFPQLPQLGGKEGPGYRLTWVDPDGEEVELDTSHDLSEALAAQQSTGGGPLEVRVQEPLHVARSGMMEEWEAVKEQEAMSPPLAAQLAPADPPPAIHQLEEKSDDKPAASAAAAAPPASSPSSGWSVFNLFGLGSTAAPTAAPTVPAVQPAAPAPPAVDEPAAEPASVVLDRPLTPQPLVQDVDSSVPSLSGSGVMQAAEREFWEMASDADVQNPEGQSHSQGEEGNSFVQAMDAQFAAGGRNAWDSAELTADVLSAVFNLMIRRTEERIGLGDVRGAASPARSAGSLVRPPHPALLSALRGLHVRDFDRLIEQFATTCVTHVARREAEERAAEAARLEAAVALLTRQKEEEERASMAAQAAEQARVQEAERAEREKQAAVVQERQRQEDALRAAEEEMRRQVLMQQEQEQEARLAALKVEADKAKAQVAEAERLQREREAAAAAAVAAAVPVPAQPLSPAVLAPAVAHPQPVRAQPLPNNSQAPRSAPQPSPAPVDSPAFVVPLVPIPVASPVSPAPASAAQRFNQALSELRAMGFTDDALNTYMLQKTNLDIAATVDWLMTDAAVGGQLKNELASGAR